MLALSIACVESWHAVYVQTAIGVWLVQVAWQKGAEVQQVWGHVVALLAFCHVWVRKAAGRLLGLLLSNTKLGTSGTSAFTCMRLLLVDSRSQSCH